MTPAATLSLRAPRCRQCGRASHAEALDHEAVGARAAVLAALSDPVRLGIVELLSEHDSLCVCDIVEAFPVGQPTISHHLRLLRHAGLVDVERRGHWAFYGLRRDVLKRVVQDLVRLL
ncbi:MAG: metalloregulator ArsR/SmtB family transcription factor [Armatimonadota bacterium]|nr:metalloregulator ArsR/SmtB family transcription factor [Armatimonadota bacterium]MDR7537339.1 metalloregulator ArsR/SmtB family transcription factor [Armatimonadota bacterium]